jgi:hypothetical protein
MSRYAFGVPSHLSPSSVGRDFGPTTRIEPVQTGRARFQYFQYSHRARQAGGTPLRGEVGEVLDELVDCRHEALQHVGQDGSLFGCERTEHVCHQ